MWQSGIAASSSSDPHPVHTSRERAEQAWCSMLIAIRWFQVSAGAVCKATVLQVPVQGRP